MFDISNGTWGLLVASLTVTGVASVGVYEGLFVMPAWFAQVPKSLELMRSRKTIRFWIPLQIVSIGALIFSIITNWHVHHLRILLSLAAISYGLVWVFTAAYFVPGVIRFSKIDLGGAYSASLERQGKNWLTWSWIRQILMLVAAIALLLTLASK